jgi:hypothetical protein
MSSSTGWLTDCWSRCWTPALFLQYEDVLKRPEQLRASRRTRLTSVLEAAINGQADALVTYNVRHFAQAAARFGLRLARPAEVLEEISI